ncbi:MAG: transposase [Christensenellaceae bacterium]
MRSTRIPAQEQYRFIMECRQSGLTDHQWCMEHDIKPGTFYNWVKRFREKGCTELLPATGRSCETTAKQEVVKVDFKNPDTYNPAEPAASAACNYSMPVSKMAAMQLSIDTCTLSIPNGTDPHLLAETLRVMKEFAC